jgi:hypothetical protein
MGKTAAINLAYAYGTYLGIRKPRLETGGIFVGFTVVFEEKPFIIFVKLSIRR